MATEKEITKLFDMYRPIVHEKIKTGILPFDILSGGGIRIGSCVAIGGAEGAGKSTMYLHMVRNLLEQGKRVAYVDAEKSGAFLEQLESFGLTKYTQFAPDFVAGTVPQLYYVNSIVTYGEFQDFCRKLISYKDTLNYEFIILDSISALAQEKMVNGDCEAAAVAYDALPISKLIKSVRGILYNAGISLFFVAQAASNIGAGLYDAEWVVKLTRAIRHTVDLLYIIEKPDYNKYKIKETGNTVQGTESEIEVGYYAKFWSIKNRTCRSQKLEVPFIYGKGVDNVRQVLDLLYSSGRLTSRADVHKLNLTKVEGQEVRIDGWDALVKTVHNQYNEIVQYLFDCGQFNLSDGNYMIDHEDDIPITEVAEAEQVEDTAATEVTMSDTEDQPVLASTIQEE